MFLVPAIIIAQLLSFIASGAELPDPIRLLSPKKQLTTNGFYINSIIDQRADKQAIGRLVVAGAEFRPVDLHGGGYSAIRNFLLQSVVENKSGLPVNISIKNCTISETISAAGEINGRVESAFEFGLEKETGNVVLTQYRSVAKYTRKVNRTDVIEPTLRAVLTNSLQYFTSWMIKEAGRNAKLATAVKISFSDFSDQDADTVYYDASKPLTWNDFKGAPANSRFAAEIFSGLGYDQRSKIIEGTIHVDLALKIYMIKSASWVRPGSKDSFSLNHEQRHFDLAKLIGEEFKRKLTSENLTVDNYEGIINFEYIEFLRAMNKVQERYDAETLHGRNYAVQDQWNKKIDQQLAGLGQAPVTSSD